MNVNINDVKETIRKLNLNKYFDILYNNSKKLQLANPDSGYYTEDGAYVDIYNPDAYIIRLFLIYKDNKMYLGNEQIPNTPDYDNHKRTANMIEYWFRGDNSFYTVLHEFIGVHNKSVSERGCGCNQKTLNIIKGEIIEAIKTNLNVNDIGEIDSEEIKLQYGKNISMYKAETKRLLKSTSAQVFADNIYKILKHIEENPIKWANFLYNKNRYFMISIEEEDINERYSFLSSYGNLDEVYIAVLIIMKEYFLWQLSEYLGNKNNYYKTIFSKIEYIRNPKCTSIELYDWKKMWDNSKPIEMIFSICYKNVYADEVSKQKGMYRKFRENLYKNISKKNNDK